jgi:uncharacterized protein involved in exopolysaccharide biosynthesis
MAESQKSRLDEDIDFLGLVKSVWQARRVVYGSVAVFLVLGLFLAFGSSDEYTSHVRLLPELKQAPRIGGGLSGLARQFGVTGGADLSGDGIPPDLYPDIAQNLVLMTRLLEYEIQVEGVDRRVTMFEYFTEHRRASSVDVVKAWTVYLPFTVKYLVSQRMRSSTPQPVQVTDELTSEKWNRIIILSTRQWEIIEELRSRISVSMVPENGVVTVSVRMPEARMAADVADQVVQFLTDYITEYRTGKARRDMEFISERYDESLSRFELAQVNLARFRDENRGQLTEVGRIQQERLQSEFDHTFNLYSTMATRLEEARIKLQEDAPVVNILEPAAVSDRRSAPKRGKILVFSLILGVALGVGLIFGKPQFRRLAQAW